MCSLQRISSRWPSWKQAAKDRSRLPASKKTNKVVARLKKEAAALGANGILLQGIGNGTAGSVGTYSGSSYGGGSTGVGISAPVMIKEGSAMAIYVTQ